jgi:hypothetical protein
MEFRYGKRELYHADELFTVGDVHGEDLKLEDLLKQVTPFLDNNPNCHIVFCGDLCNGKGPNSARVFELLIDLKNKYPTQAFFIMGNHEEMLITTIQGKSIWMEYTKVTWDSMNKHWGVNMLSIQQLAKECLDRGVIDFLDGLIPYYENDTFICTHAPLDRSTCYMHGIKDYKENFGKQGFQSYFLERLGSSIRWEFTTEDPKLSRIPDMKKFIICGHQFKHHKQPRLFKHRAFVDVGCGYAKHRDLVAVKFPEKKVFRSIILDKALI